MVKNFIIKHKPILLTVVITAAVTSAVASGYFVIRNEKKISNQKVETLQKSIEDLQSKNAEYQEITTNVEKEAPVSEVPATLKKNVVVAPIKVEEAKETLVSCVAFDGTTIKVSEDECDEIKQKNIIAERAMDKYDDCISSADDYLSDAKEKYENRMDGGYAASIVADYNNSIEEYNDMTKECVAERNAVLKKLQ